MKFPAVFILPLFLLASCTSAPLPAADVKSADSPLAGKASYAAAPEVLRVWVNGRAGTGETVHWIAEGGVYAYPSGDKLMGMIGLDSSTVFWPDEPGEKILHLTRKTFAYTDPVTGEVLKEYKGNPVDPIAYPYQMIHYRLENNRVYGDVEQGVGDAVRTIKSTDGIGFNKLGNSYVFNASVFLDFPLPGGNQYEAWENYDFFFHPDDSLQEPHQMSWQRYGKLPKWAGGGKSITHLLSWRVENQSEIPPHILRWVKADKPMWLKPPRDVEEVRALQRGEGGPGWSG